MLHLFAGYVSYLIYMYVYKYTYIYRYTHVYICTCVYMYTHIQIYIVSWWKEDWTYVKWTQLQFGAKVLPRIFSYLNIKQVLLKKKKTMLYAWQMM